jgi:hypothetical protein
MKRAESFVINRAGIHQAILSQVFILKEPVKEEDGKVPSFVNLTPGLLKNVVICFLNPSRGMNSGKCLSFI